MAKTLSEIYDSIKARFYNRTKLDIERGTVVDMYVLASSDSIKEAMDEIEASKNPHIFTKLVGEDLDSTGYLVSCPRMANESDDSYKHRLMEWATSNEASNIIAIENALMELTYASYAMYVPLTEGVGTASVYIIPKEYTQSIKESAVQEVKDRLSKVISPGSIITYIIPKERPVKLIAYVSSDNGDLDSIKSNIEFNVIKYVNGIAPGSFLEIGEINKMGVNEPNVDYFNIVQVYIDDKETASLKVLQKIDSKFIFDQIIWQTVVR